LLFWGEHEDQAASYSEPATGPASIASGHPQPRSQTSPLYRRSIRRAGRGCQEETWVDHGGIRLRAGRIHAHGGAK
jgi:hypothetical protein